MSTICKLETGSDPRQPLVVKAQNCESGFKIARNFRLKSSTPERAILEAIAELPSNASFSNLDKTFESMRTLRPRLLVRLLTACRSIKVRRLFFLFADRHRHPWFEKVPASEIDLGSGPRALVKGGKFDPKYRISVPREFAEMSDLEF